PGQGPQEEPEVRGPLRETPHEVRVPLPAVGDVHPDLRALRRETPLLLRADAVEHLVLEGAGVTVVQHRQGARDLDEPGVVRGEHRVALACHQDLHAPHERPVDLFPVGEGHRGGSGVGALAQPDARPLVGEFRTVLLCAAQVRLDDGTDVGEVAPQFVDDPQRRVDGGVVLHVEGDRRPGVAGGRADATGVGQGEVLVEGLPQCRQLRRHLGARTETGGAEAFQQLDVVLDVRLGPLLVVGVLPEDVHGDEESLGGQVAGDAQGVLDGLPGDEPADHLIAERRGLHDPAHALTARRDEQRLTKHCEPLGGRRRLPAGSVQVTPGPAADHETAPPPPPAPCCRTYSSIFAVLTASNSAFDFAGSRNTTLCLARVPVPRCGVVMNTTSDARTPRMLSASDRRSPADTPSSTLIDLVSADRNRSSFSGLASVPRSEACLASALRNACWRLIRSKSPFGRLYRCRTKSSASSPFSFCLPAVHCFLRAGSYTVSLMLTVTPPSASVID